MSFDAGTTKPVTPASNQAWIERESCHGAPNYHPLPVVLTKAQGVWAYDVEDKCYLDMMSAYSALNFGHSHPHLVAALSSQAARLAMCSRAFHNDQLPLFCEKLSELTGLDRVLPMNTGAEAVETALKAARRWGYEVKGIPNDRAEIIVCEQNFHGRTTTIISFSSEEGYKRHFGPLTPGFRTIPFDDVAALEAAITPHTCAFLVEPVQGEAGIYPAKPGYLSECLEICRRHRVLMMVDEIQTGLGRTGQVFAYQHDQITPDVLILGKALGGGLLPISAVIAHAEVLDLMGPGSHGSTFGGNPLACHVACTALKMLTEQDLASKAAEMGTWMMERLQKMQLSCVREIRGRGLMIGLDIDPQMASARQVCEALLNFGILSKDTHQTVVRLAPPLVITREELSWGLEQIEACLKGFSSS
ncbi:MAG: ornithine--oxo-acid transaminase [Holosporales bacterium]